MYEPETPAQHAGLEILRDGISQAIKVIADEQGEYGAQEEFARRCDLKSNVVGYTLKGRSPTQPIARRFARALRQTLGRQWSDEYMRDLLWPTDPDATPSPPTPDDLSGLEQAARAILEYVENQRISYVESYEARRRPASKRVPKGGLSKITQRIELDNHKNDYRIQPPYQSDSVVEQTVATLLIAVNHLPVMS